MLNQIYIYIYRLMASTCHSTLLILTRCSIDSVACRDFSVLSSEKNSVNLVYEITSNNMAMRYKPLYTRVYFCKICFKVYKFIAHSVSLSVVCAAILKFHHAWLTHCGVVTLYGALLRVHQNPHFRQWLGVDGHIPEPMILIHWPIPRMILVVQLVAW